jgi:hypothetical protein
MAIINPRVTKSLHKSGNSTLPAIYNVMAMEAREIKTGKRSD